jgi:uncharacterized protein (TIGR02117 family)
MRRRRAVLLIGVLVALATAFPAPARDLQGPNADDCVPIALWSNGFHTSLSVPAAALGQGHPLRRAMPQADYLLVGWGDEGFYRAGGLWQGVDAVIPPSATVIHLIGAHQPVETFYRASRLQPIALSRAQAAGLAAFLAEETEVDANGEPVVLSQGHAGPNSLFVRSTSTFHGLNVCNHWTARALRAAGLDVGSRLSFRADGVLADAARSSPAICPTG